MFSSTKFYIGFEGNGKIIVYNMPHKYKPKTCLKMKKYEKCRSLSPDYSTEKT